MDATMVGGIVRALLAAAGGGLIAKGVVSASDWELYIGAFVTLATGAWSVYQKYQARKA